MDEETKDVTKEEVQDEQQDTEQRDDEEHSIYDFIKEDGGIICAAGSALITILAFGLRMSSYLYHLAYLRYWDVDPNLISAPENYWLENIALSLLLVVSGITYMNQISNLSREHAVKKTFYKRNSKELKKLEKKRRQIQREINRKRSTLEKTRNEHSSTYYEDLKSDLDQADAQITELQKGSEPLKQKIADSRKKHNKQYVISLAIWSIVFAVVTSISFLRTAYSLQEKFLFVVFIVIFYWLSASIMTRILLRIKLSKLSDEDLIEEINKNSGVTALFKRGGKSLLSNKKIFVAIFVMAYYGTAFLILQNYMGKHVAQHKNTFMIIQNSGSSYAVVASDSDYLIAEPIIINGNTADIITEQKIVFSKENEPIIETIEFATPPKIKKEAKQ